jgi:hypothetical protein
MQNSRCETKDSAVECDTEYVDYFKVTHIWGGTKRVRTECLNHAAHDEQKGMLVELIDRR